MSALELAESAFFEIRASFPDLTSRIDREPEGGLDLEVVFPEQPGLSFDVSLNLQNVDELHLSAPGLWVEWFPCTKPEVLAQYVDAVSGLIAGSHRVLQYRQRGRLIKSYLQRPVGEAWETIARCYPGIALPFLRSETSVVANVPAV